MANTQQPTPATSISNQQARRFMLAHQHLWPPRRLKGKDGILSLFDRLGCIQFDPINVVGRNPDLVLQSRVANYKQSILESLLYEDRRVIDGWDKVASIYRVEDWPYFSRRREAVPRHHNARSKDAMDIAPKLLDEIRRRGPLSSLDFKDNEKTDWFWGPTSISRAGLELLNVWGKLGVHHKVNTRRIFDLIERLIPAEILAQGDPNPTEKAYQDWHVLRRIGSMGLASLSSGEHWLDIRGVKAPQRREIVERLTQQGKVIPLAVEGLENHSLYIRTSDLDTLDSIRGKRGPKAQAAFIAPLDNFMWNRKLIQHLFNFSYTWEVYKPPAKREYGYYVLPVLYGDRFVARMDPAFDKKTRVLTVNNWWWEEGVTPDDPMLEAITACVKAFGRYLDASEIILDPQAALPIQL
ncbi:MAG: crosslink repair DNA glycosylase YcaQ family protein [Anaerolineales bacterium]|jgi:hypothetical protein